jgi:CMP-N-acetylneuraminic acid synthetase
MFKGKKILAVVPARSGSKGVPDKNMRQLAGRSLIARAAECLGSLEWLDRAIISTDSKRYAEEAKTNGLAAPFLRPGELASDTAGAVETLQHAVTASEAEFRESYDIILIIEPTSPLRKPEDLTNCIKLLLTPGADSVVTVSAADTKYHPRKLLLVEHEKLKFFTSDGASLSGRQQLAGSYFFRNGVCYALTRNCIMNQEKIISDNTVPLVIDRPLVNIDTPIELEWAEFLHNKQS